MHKSTIVSFVVASRRPLASVAVLASVLSIGRPDVARAEDYHWDAPIAAEKPLGNVARKPSASAKRSVGKKPTNKQNAKSRKAKPQ
jgi:hypothetical protein